MPTAGCDALLHELSVAGRIHNPLPSVTARIAKQAGRRHVASTVVSAVAARYQMLCSALEAIGLALGQAIMSRERFRLS